MIVPRTVIVPCAGIGTRLLPITKLVPKELLPVGTKPAIQHIVEEAVAAGIRRIVLVCHPTKIPIADHFRPDPTLDRVLAVQGRHAERQALDRLAALADLTVVYQEEPRGLGDAICRAEPAVGDAPFCVMLPDVLIFGAPPMLGRLIAMCRHHTGWGLLLQRVSPAQIPSCGVIGGAAVGSEVYRVTEAVEKPPAGAAPTDLAIVGRYLLPPKIFPLLRQSRPGAGGEIQLTDAIHRLARTEPIYGLLCHERIWDIGTMEGWMAAATFAQQHLR